MAKQPNMLSRQLVSHYSRKLGPAPPASSILQSSAFLNPLLAPTSTTIRTINWTREIRRRRSSKLRQHIASKLISQINDPSTIGDDKGKVKRRSKVDEVETERSKWRRRLKSRKRAAELDQTNKNMSPAELLQLKFHPPKSPTTPDAPPLQTDNVLATLDQSITLPYTLTHRTPRLSEALRLPALPDQVFIDKDLTINFDTNTHELQSQIWKMQGLFERASGPTQDLLWKRWKSKNPEVLRSWLKILVSKWQARDGGMSGEAHEHRGTDSAEVRLASMYEAGGMTFLLDETPQLAGASGHSKEATGDGNSGKDALPAGIADQQGSMIDLVPTSSEESSADTSPGNSPDSPVDGKNESSPLAKGTGKRKKKKTKHVAASPEEPSTETSSPKESSTDTSPEESSTHTSLEKPSADEKDEEVSLSKGTRKQQKLEIEHVATSPKELITDTSPKEASTYASPKEVSMDAPPKESSMGTSPAEPSADGNSDKDSLSTNTSDQQELTTELVATSPEKPSADEKNEGASPSKGTGKQEELMTEYVNISPKESSMDTFPEKTSADGENERSSKGTGKQKKKKKKKKKLSAEQETVEDALSRLSRPDPDRPISLTEGPSSNPTATQNPPLPTALPHLTSTGTAHMVSVSAKPHTTRTAIAVGVVCFTNPTPLSLIRSNALKKGDVLSVSRIAGIMAAKKCPDLIPLCHPIALTHVGIEVKAFGPDDTALASASETVGEHGGVVVEATVQCTGPTGVEMEALTAVMGAALTVVDMCKAVDKFQRVERVRVVRKEGGKSGTWNEEGWKSCM
jgi:molybdenum cofactor biosynthesis protein MoaC